MTAGPEIKGWCPGALRPMLSGDGLVVRIRPPMGRLSPAQAAAIARVSTRYGNGIIDLSARANLQLRGVREDCHGALIEDLRAKGLIDPDIETESLRNLIVTPFRASPPTPSLPHKGESEPPPAGLAHDARTQRLPSPPWGGDGGGGHPAERTDNLAACLTAALARLPRLPGKFGFALDCGANPVLTDASADIRVERAADGRLILRPDGHPLGRPVTDLAGDLLDMAEWFVAEGGVRDGRGRMAALVARGARPLGCDTAPAPRSPIPEPGRHAEGTMVALAFGQMRAGTLAGLAGLGHEIRLTPWRMLFLAGAESLPDIPGLITAPDAPLLRITACTGAPGCAQAAGDTRRLGRLLAPYLPAGQRLHVSGCAKGCAHPAPADLTLTATPEGYDLIRNGTAADAPALAGLRPDSIKAYLKDLHAPSL